MTEGARLETMKGSKDTGKAASTHQDAGRRRLLSDVAAEAAVACWRARLAASVIRQQHVWLERQRSCSSAVSGGVFIKQKT